MNRIYANPASGFLNAVLAVLLYAGVLPLCASQTAEHLTLRFTNDTAHHYESEELWIYFDNGGGATPFDVTYNDGIPVSFGTYTTDNKTHTHALSDGIRLADVNSSEFTVRFVSSVAVFITYGSPFTDLSVSPGFFEDSVSGDIVFQNFEITRTGGDGDQGNLTNINYFTAPLSIKSYSDGHLMQETAFHAGTPAISAEIAALSTANAVHNDTGQLVRYVGPSTWASNPPYPSFETYLLSIHESGITNKIVNSNAFNTDGSSGTDGTNYNFQLNLTSTVKADGSITLTGNVSTELKDNTDGTLTTGPTFQEAGITFKGSDIDALNSIIYGQATENFADSVTWGPGWDAFKAYVTDPAQNLTGQDVFGTTQRLAVGEITTAILMGFLGNPTEVNGTPLNDMESREWWRLNPMHAFAEIQSNPDNYNPYAEVIYALSNNGVYGIPYSDRLGSGPLVNTVQFTRDQTSYPIDTWVVGIGTPVTHNPPQSLPPAQDIEDLIGPVIEFNGWVWSLEHGTFLFPIETLDGSGGYFFYDATLGHWWYGNPGVYPWIHLFGSALPGTGGWNYFFQNTFQTDGYRTFAAPGIIAAPVDVLFWDDSSLR